MLSFSKGDRRSEKRPETASLQGILDGNVSDFIAIFRSFLKKNTTIRYLEAIKMAGKGARHLLLLRNKNSCWYGRSMTGDTTVPWPWNTRVASHGTTVTQDDIDLL